VCLCVAVDYPLASVLRLLPAASIVVEADRKKQEEEKSNRVAEAVQNAENLRRFNHFFERLVAHSHTQTLTHSHRTRVFTCRFKAHDASRKLEVAKLEHTQERMAELQRATSSDVEVELCCRPPTFLLSTFFCC